MTLAAGLTLATVDCQYVADQVMMKATYRLWVTPAERAAMEGVLRGC